MPARQGSTSASTHAPGALVGQRPGEPAEHAQAVSGEELVRLHSRLQSLNAVSSLVFSSSGIASSGRDAGQSPRSSGPDRRSGSSRRRSSDAARTSVICSAVIAPSRYSEASSTISWHVYTCSGRAHPSRCLSSCARTRARARWRRTRWFPWLIPSSLADLLRGAPDHVAERDHGALRLGELGDRPCDEVERLPCDAAAPRAAFASRSETTSSLRDTARRRRGTAPVRRAGSSSPSSSDENGSERASRTARSRAMLATIRNTQVRSVERPSKRSMPLRTAIQASCTTSSATLRTPA